MTGKQATDKKRANLSRPTTRGRRKMQEAFVDQEAEAPAEVLTMFTIRMNIDLHRRLKTRAFKEGRTMKDIVEEQLREYLDDFDD